MIRIEHILCPVDFSEFSSRALHHAGALAYKHGARLTALHVVPITDLPLPRLTDDDRRRLTDQVRDFGADLPGEVSFDIRVCEAPAAGREILRQATETRADLLVIGSHGRSGFERFLLGSVTEKVMRAAPCPTLVVPRRAGDVIVDEPVRFRRILCSIDFSPTSTHALHYTRCMVDEEGGQIILLHALEVPPELRANPLVEGYDVAKVRAGAEADCLRRLQQFVPEIPPRCSVKTLVREGAAYREILTVAAERSVDLIVMGVHGRGAMDLLAFGSNTARVSRAATVPVLIVPRAYQVREL